MSPPIPLATSLVFSEVASERAKQDAKQNFEEIAEAFADPVALRAELVQCAAVIVAWIEGHRPAGAAGTLRRHA